MFELKTFQKLCELDNLIVSIPNSIKFLTKLPFSFNLPNYAMCLNPELKNCSQLTQQKFKIFYKINLKKLFFSIDAFKYNVETCIKNPVKLSCNTEIALQIKNYILQKPFKNQYKILPTGNIYIGAILKVVFFKRNFTLFLRYNYWITILRKIMNFTKFY